jgi:hypothetical protein
MTPKPTILLLACLACLALTALAVQKGGLIPGTKPMLKPATPGAHPSSVPDKLLARERRMRQATNIPPPLPTAALVAINPSPAIAAYENFLRTNCGITSFPSPATISNLNAERIAAGCDTNVAPANSNLWVYVRPIPFPVFDVASQTFHSNTTLLRSVNGGAFGVVTSYSFGGAVGVTAWPLTNQSERFEVR